MNKRYSIVVTALFILILFVLGFGISIVKVEGTSMEPLIMNGERILILHFAYGIKRPFTTGYFIQWKTPEKSDLVAFVSPATAKTAIKNQFILEKGNYQLTENLLQTAWGNFIVSDQSKNALLQNKESESPLIFVIGSNSAFSVDSRSFGPLRLEEIIGKVILFSRATND